MAKSEHVHKLEVFYILDCCGNVATVPKPHLSVIPLFLILDNKLKRHNPAKINKKSVFLFLLFNMAI